LLSRYQRIGFGLVFVLNLHSNLDVNFLYFSEED